MGKLAWRGIFWLNCGKRYFLTKLRYGNRNGKDTFWLNSVGERSIRRKLVGKRHLMAKSVWKRHFLTKQFRKIHFMANQARKIHLMA